MPDLVGLGLSDRASHPALYTLDNHSRWMALLLGQLQLEDVIAVVQDWGGPIGVHALTRHPGMCTGLVVMNTSLMPPKEGFKPTTFHRFFSTRFGDFATSYLGLPQRALRFAQADRSSISGKTSRAYSFPLSRARGNEAVAALVRMVPDSLEHPSVKQLREIKSFIEGFTRPTALVWGKSDPILGGLLNQHHRVLTDARVVETEAGHFLQEEVPVEIAAAIRWVAA